MSPKCEYIAIDEDMNIGFGKDPLEAINDYNDQYGFYTVEDGSYSIEKLSIYKLTNIKAKSTIVLSTDGT